MNGCGRFTSGSWTRSSGNRRAVPCGIVYFLVGILPLLSFPVGFHEALAADPDRIEVKKEPGGGVHAWATVVFQANPVTVQALLTDYQHWPDLFDTRMRVAELTIRDGVATVDLRIEHPLMPGEHRLVTDSKTLPNGVLVTDLKGGDFKRYHRVWTLVSTGDGNHTSADFELVVEPALMVPDWLVAMVTRQELETHFRIVKQKLAEQATR